MSRGPDPTGRTRAWTCALLLAALAGGLFFHGLGRYALWDPDEARHAEVARELAEARGIRRLFLPTLHFKPYQEKPAPYYWLVALSYGVAGVGAWAARAVSATAGLATVLAVYAYALPRVGVEGAFGAGLVLATSAGWFVLARFVNLDMTLTAFVVTGVLSGLAWLDQPPPRRPPLVPYVAGGLGALVKGPLALALVGGPLLLAGLLQRPRPSWRELGLVRGALVVAAVVGLLWVPVAILDVGYLRAFAWTNLRRLGAKSPHAEPAYYYLLWLPVLFLPWTPLALPALRSAARDPARRPLVLWALFVPALLTLARGKLAGYALSALPPLALVVGPELARMVRAGPGSSEPLLRVGGWLVAAIFLALAVAIAVMPPVYPVPLAGRALLAVATAGTAVALALALARQRLTVVPLTVLGAVLGLYPLVVGFVAPAVSAVHSDEEAARLARSAQPAPVIAYFGQAHSLVFYLERTVIHTHDKRVVRELFEGDGPVFLVTGNRHFVEVEQLLGDRAHRWYGTRRRRLYANRPPPA